MKKEKKKISKIQKILLKVLGFLLCLGVFLFLVKLNIVIGFSWQNIGILIILSFILGGIYGAYKMHKDLHS
jgi:ABC-type antimicrobial peptide transport system permease subunit